MSILLSSKMSPCGTGTNCHLAAYEPLDLNLSYVDPRPYQHRLDRIFRSVRSDVMGRHRPRGGGGGTDLPSYLSCATAWPELLLPAGGDRNGCDHRYGAASFLGGVTGDDYSGARIEDGAGGVG